MEHSPRILNVLVAVGLLYVVNQRAPGVLQGVLLLVALYLVLAHAPKAGELLSVPARSLGSALSARVPVAGGGSGGGGRW